MATPRVYPIGMIDRERAKDGARQRFLTSQCAEKAQLPALFLEES
jgi:hypothetical protein